MDALISFGATTAITFFVFLIGVPIFMAFLRLFGLYCVVREGTCHVYVLFGKVLGIYDEPGLYLLPLKIGPKALLVNLLGERYVLDMRLDQQYLRSQPVN
ncbi:MAG: SPFH/Band 7/PHB domain protein, partial [Proteobacteria bacterium]|nr:SPFH/Band 7/PHB domain protein [Pseudomonadota bacterium]